MKKEKIVVLVAAVTMIWIGFLAFSSIIVVYIARAPSMHSFKEMLLIGGITVIPFFVGGIFLFLLGSYILLHLYCFGSKTSK